MSGKSEFEEIFGNIDNLSQVDQYLHCLAIIRDDPKLNGILDRFAPVDSLVSEPLCVLFALHKAMEKLERLENGYILVGNFGSQECDQVFRDENNEIILFDDLDEAIRVNIDDCYYGRVTYLGKEED